MKTRPRSTTGEARLEKIPVYCYQCVAGPDLLKVVVKDRVAVGVEPNTEMADVHPAGGTVCVRAYALIQKLYNPARIGRPMRRTNPRKGRDEDPGFTAEQKDFQRFYTLYWIGSMLVFLVIVALAAWDVLAIRRTGRRLHRQLQDERRAMIAEQLARLRGQANDPEAP